MQQMQQKQDETVGKILQGMERIKDSSRKHTSEVLLQVAEMFLKGKRKKKAVKILARLIKVIYYEYIYFKLD